MSEEDKMSDKEMALVIFCIGVFFVLLFLQRQFYGEEWSEEQRKMFHLADPEEIEYCQNHVPKGMTLYGMDAMPVEKFGCIYQDEKGLFHNVFHVNAEVFK